MGTELNLINLKSLAPPKVLFARFTGKKMVNLGLRGRRLGPGRYRFRREDKDLMEGIVTVLVQLDEPWASERTMTAALACLEHGLSCPVGSHEETPAKTRQIPIEVLRWMPEVRLCNLQNLDEIYGKSPMDQVIHLAKIADAAGADGFVCSPLEVGVLSSLPWNRKKLFVVPGIRSEGASAGDQQRVGTPKGAMQAGATHLVIGRQILESYDPVAEVLRLRLEIG